MVALLMIQIHEIFAKRTCAIFNFFDINMQVYDKK